MQAARGHWRAVGCCRPTARQRACARLLPTYPRNVLLNFWPNAADECRRSGTEYPRVARATAVGRFRRRSAGSRDRCGNGGGDFVAQVAVGRRNQAHLYLARSQRSDPAAARRSRALAAASPARPAATPRPRRETACRRQPSRTARPCVGGTGEGTADMPEQLALEQVSTTAEQLDGHESLGAARASLWSARAAAPCLFPFRQ